MSMYPPPLTGRLQSEHSSVFPVLQKATSRFHNYFLRQLQQPLVYFLNWIHYRIVVEFNRSDKQGTAAAGDGITLCNRSSNNATLSSVPRSVVQRHVYRLPLCLNESTILNLAQLWKPNPEKKQCANGLSQQFTEWTLTSPSQPFQQGDYPGVKFRHTSMHACRNR